MVEMTESLSVTDDSLWGKVVASKSVSRFYASLVRMTGSSGGKGATTQGATPVPISLSVAPVSTKKGEAAGFVVLISDARHMAGIAEESAARIADLERGLGEMVQSLSDARSNEAQLRGSIDQFKAAEAHTRSAIDASRRLEAELRKDVDRLREEEGSLRKSAQQLLEINRLKSEFIVNAGRELEATLQSVLGLAELLEQGTYGPLTGEQMQAIRGIYSNARRMRQDVDWLVEYGSTRSRRLEPGSGGS
jgi:signal transduction histidine kinase